MAIMQDTVHLMIQSIAEDVSRDEPTTCLRNFENNTGFYKSSEGQLALLNIDSAKKFYKQRIDKKFANNQFLME